MRVYYNLCSAGVDEIFKLAVPPVLPARKPLHGEGFRVLFFNLAAVGIAHGFHVEVFVNTENILQHLLLHVCLRSDLPARPGTWVGANTRTIYRRNLHRSASSEF